MLAVLDTKMNNIYISLLWYPSFKLIDVYSSEWCLLKSCGTKEGMEVEAT